MHLDAERHRPLLCVTPACLWDHNVEFTTPGLLGCIRKRDHWLAVRAGTWFCFIPYMVSGVAMPGTFALMFRKPSLVKWRTIMPINSSCSLDSDGFSCFLPFPLSGNLGASTICIPANFKICQNPMVKYPPARSNIFGEGNAKGYDP